MAMRHELALSRVFFLDETGSHAAMARRVGWSQRGERVAIEKPVYAKNVSVIGVIGLRGVVTSMAVQGSVDTEVFAAFVREFLLPELEPGDILVMDNLHVHKVQSVLSLFEAADVTVLFQPPYSPDLNPIELLWARVKGRLRQMTPRTIPRLIRDIGKALNEVTPENCAAWFRHCGYLGQES